MEPVIHTDDGMAATPEPEQTLFQPETRGADMGMLAGEKTHTLAYPITIASEGRTITEVRMRRSKVRDQRIASQGGGTPAEMEIRLISILCGLSPEAIDEMDDKDYDGLQKIYRSFLS